MTLEDQLKAVILERYKSIREFSASIGMPYSTIDSVLKRGVTNSGVNTMLKVFKALDLDIESIHDGILRKSSKKSAPSTRDEALLQFFHQLNNEGQERLLETADDMVRSGKYKKSDSVGLDTEVAEGW